MKKTFLLVLGFVLALAVSAQRNSFYYGDKNTEEIVNSIRAFDQLIADHETSIVSLKRDNERMTASFQRSGSGQFASVYAKRTAVNDSLISLHQSKVFDLKETKQRFLEMTAGNPKRRAVSSRGNNPEKLRAAASAYAVMTYTDAYVREGASSFQNGEHPVSGLKGAIVNDYFKTLTVTVRGEGGWMNQFNVPGNGGKAFFNPPFPGRYTFSFYDGIRTKTVQGDCRPGLMQFQDAQGNKYDLMATMPRGY